MTAQNTIEQINQAIRGFSVLRRLSIVANENYSRYDLTLELSDGPSVQSRRVCIICIGMSGFRSKDLGGGLTQLLLLKVHELGQSGFEGAIFEVNELERNSISFKCESISLRSTHE